jgi:hypothetical protein
MDASPLFDPQYLPIIVATLVGFSALALVLLVPIYRFLDREQEVSEEWTPEELAKRRREQQATENGTSGAADAEAKSKDAPG